MNKKNNSYRVSKSVKFSMGKLIRKASNLRVNICPHKDIIRIECESELKLPHGWIPGPELPLPPPMPPSYTYHSFFSFLFFFLYPIPLAPIRPLPSRSGLMPSTRLRKRSHPHLIRTLLRKVFVEYSCRWNYEPENKNPRQKPTIIEGPKFIKMISTQPAMWKGIVKLQKFA